MLVCIWTGLKIYCWVTKLLPQPKISVKDTPAATGRPTTANSNFVTSTSSEPKSSITESKVGRSTSSGKTIVDKSRVRKTELKARTSTTAPNV